MSRANKIRAERRWRNGRLDALKTHCPKGRVGSNPTRRTSVAPASHVMARWWSMAREVSVRELRNSTAEVVAAVQAGERLSLTVNHRPVADIVPHNASRSPWVPASTLLRVLDEVPADAALLRDLAEVRGAVIEKS